MQYLEWVACGEELRREQKIAASMLGSPNQSAEKSPAHSRATISEPGSCHRVQTDHERCGGGSPGLAGAHSQNWKLTDSWQTDGYFLRISTTQGIHNGDSEIVVNNGQPGRQVASSAARVVDLKG